MDDTTIQEIKHLAEQNGLDPEQLLALAGEDKLPAAMKQGMTAILGDIAIFEQALDKLKK